jgi:hypothetical protein
MTQYPSAAARSSAQRGWTSATWIRMALAAALWCLAAPPIYVMGTTAAKFEEIFRELGLRISPLQMTLLGLGRMLESPAVMLGVLVMLGAFCFAASLACIPFGAVAPADGVGMRPRWKRIVMTVVGVGLLSFGLVVAYMGTMLGSMQTVIDKLNNTPPSTPAKSASAP